MDYDPADHAPTARQVTAAWLACFLMGAAVFGGDWAWHRAHAVIAAAHAQAGRTPSQLCQRPELPLHGVFDPRRAGEPPRG
jgi:hypothetical protein